MWRMLHEAAINPWQYEQWLFPKDPRFAEKAGPILDLYAGDWEGKPLGAGDFELSMDEKTSIQASARTHKETPPKPKQTRRVESEYGRKGALQAWGKRYTSHGRECDIGVEGAVHVVWLWFSTLEGSYSISRWLSVAPPPADYVGDTTTPNTPHPKTSHSRPRQV